MERKNTHQIFVLFKEFVTVAKQELIFWKHIFQMHEINFVNGYAKVICHIFKVYDSYRIVTF